MAIGNVYMRSWTSEEENWDEKSTDPTEFPYHPDALKKSGRSASAFNSQPVSGRLSSPDESEYPDRLGDLSKITQRGADSGSFKQSHRYAELPEVVTKKLIVPFEFRFTSQELTLEIRDSSDNSLLYEV